MSGRLLVAGALASRRLARPVLVAAPSGWPSASPLAARGSPPGLARLARRRPALPVGVFAALRAASARSRSCARSRVAVLGRARPPLPRWRLPPGLGALRRACARPPRPSGALRAARGPPRACCAALAGRSCPLRPGPPCRRAGAVLRGLGRGSPGGGSRPAARASGGCVPRPRRAGGLARCGAPPCCGERADCPRRPRRKMQAGA